MVLLHQDLDVLGVIAEEFEVSPDAPPDPLQPVGNLRRGELDMLLKLRHDAVDGREEQGPLAGEVAVERPLADTQRVGQELRDAIREPLLREKLGRGRKDLLAAVAGGRFRPRSRLGDAAIHGRGGPSA